MQMRVLHYSLQEFSIATARFPSFGLQLALPAHAWVCCTGSPVVFSKRQLLHVFDLANCEHNLGGMLLLLTSPYAGLQAGL